MLLPHQHVHTIYSQLDANLIQRFQTSPQFKKAKAVYVTVSAAAAKLSLTQDFGGAAVHTGRSGGVGETSRHTYQNIC